VRRLYIAGASGEIDRVTHWMARAREAGYAITCDWPAAIVREGGVANALGPRRADYAKEDLVGVYEARTFWLLAPMNASTGAWVEFGYALALTGAQRDLPWGRAESLVVVSGPGAARSIFPALADHELPTDEEAFALLAARLEAGGPT